MLGESKTMAKTLINITRIFFWSVNWQPQGQSKMLFVQECVNRFLYITLCYHTNRILTGKCNLQISRSLLQGKNEESRDCHDARLSGTLPFQLNELEQFVSKVIFWAMCRFSASQIPTTIKWSSFGFDDSHKYLEISAPFVPVKQREGLATVIKAI